MRAGDIPGLLLLLTNVLQPVTFERLRDEVNAIVSAAKADPDIAASFGRDLEHLVRKGFIERRGMIFCTTLKGQDRLGKTGLRKARDKNRLFLLKEGFKRE